MSPARWAASKIDLIQIISGNEGTSRALFFEKEQGCDANGTSHGSKCESVRGLRVIDPFRLPVRSRLLIGAIAGFAATVAMTATMNRLHRRLPAPERYPLPPREITESLVPQLKRDESIKDAATAAHHAYGAAAGALIAAAAPTIGPVRGGAAGAAVWAASYFGWIPAAGILRGAHRHPGRRNGLMVAAHLVWGAVTALSMRELVDARATVLRAGPAKDAGTDHLDGDR